MKISNLNGVVNFLNQVREKAQGGDGDPAGNAYEPPPQKKNPYAGKQQQELSTPEAPGEEVSATELRQAIEVFSQDQQALSSGLKVTLDPTQTPTGAEGAAPGLRVTLTDADGNVIRRFTGTEFVKLRETSGSKGLIKLSGKLLDQKL